LSTSFIVAENKCKRQTNKGGLANKAAKECGMRVKFFISLRFYSMHSVVLNSTWIKLPYEFRLG